MAKGRRQDRRHRQPPDEGRPAGARRRHGGRFCSPGKTIGKSLAEPERAEDARRILATAEKNKVLVLPIDVIVAKEVTRAPGGNSTKNIAKASIHEAWNIVTWKAEQDLMVDALSDAKTVFWNGPLGVFGAILWRSSCAPGGRTDACRSRRPGRDRGDRWR